MFTQTFPTVLSSVNTPAMQLFIFTYNICDLQRLLTKIIQSKIATA